MTNWHSLKPKEVLDNLGTTADGLSGEKSKERLKKYGQNILKEKKRVTPLKIFLDQFKSFLVWILIAAVLISVGIGAYTSSSEHYIDAAVIGLIIIVNAVLGFYQEFRAEKAMEALKKLTAPKAEVIRGGKRMLISSCDLVPGDIILFGVGQRIPADARILEQMNLQVEEAALTGESVPVSKYKEAIMKESLAVSSMKNMVFMGTVVTRGRGTAIVTETGMKTEFGKIAEQIQAAPEKETPFQKKLDKLGKTLAIFILAICAVIFGMEVFRSSLTGVNIDMIEIFLISVSLAVAAVPEGLPAIVTISLALGMEKMAKSNAVVRKLSAVETLGATNVICSDKTGTLTRNEMTIRSIYANNQAYAVSGAGYEPMGKIISKGKTVKAKELEMLLNVGVLCNDSSLTHADDTWEIAGDPTEGSLLVLAAKAGLEFEVVNKKNPRVNEIGFDSTRKRMTTINRVHGGGLIACVKGAPDIVVQLCSKMLVNGKEVKMTSNDIKRILKQNEQMAGGALRVLALAYRKVDAKGKYSPDDTEKNLVFLGLVGMIDPPRKTAAEAIKVCKKAGIRVIMVTGDHKLTALAIGKELGLVGKGAVAITGEELDKMPAPELEKTIGKVAIFARVSPAHKVRILNALKSKGYVVAMTGDGVNDAPALKNADIGVAMGITGTDVSKEAADMVLEDDNFATIVKAIEGGRAVFDNIQKFLNYLLSCNLGEIFIIFVAALIGLPLPLIAVQILWMNLLTDGLPAVALAADPAAEGIMRRPPRSSKENILSKSLLKTILWMGLLIGVAALGLFWWTYSRGLSLAHARTVALATIVMLEMARLYAIRSAYKLKPFSNPYLILSVAASIALMLTIIYVPFFHPIFRTTALGLYEWAPILFVSGLIFVALVVERRFSRGAV